MRRKYRKLNTAYWATKKTKSGEFVGATYIPRSLRGEILPLAKKALQELDRERRTLQAFIDRFEGKTEFTVETIRDNVLANI